MKPLYVHQKGQVFLEVNGLKVTDLPGEFQKYFPKEDPKYIDPVSLLAGIAAGRAFEEQKRPLESGTAGDFAVVVGSGFGAIDSTVDFDAQALQKGPNAVNPMDFPNTVANAAGSRIGIWLQLKGPNVTLTNGGTSFLDAIGFAWEAYNSGLFGDCLVGAVEKVPVFLKSFPAQETPDVRWREGACLFRASGDERLGFLFEIVDYFSLQLKADFSFTSPFRERFENFWTGVEWLGFPQGTPLEPLLPKGITRFSPEPSVMEVGLGGSNSLDSFLAGSASKGIVGVFSKAERKCSFVKIHQKGREKNGNDGN
ncbi:MAG TPA: beta-ketoacyl synthase N-terminal-like domain-containing protein [bacterium]|nr:beta-ketoacyl synthase N-terminal-like domain-containing protein [bacterium]